MQEAVLHKAIYNLGSVKGMARKLGIQREHIYSWIKGVSHIPLEYALQIEYLTGGEIHWKDLVPFHIVQRLKHLTLFLPKLDLPPCELVYVSIDRIKTLCLEKWKLETANQSISLYKEPPICLDSENTIIFGEKIFAFYKHQAKKRSIPAWRISLSDLAKENYSVELFTKTFSISERVAIAIALEKFLGRHQGRRSDLETKAIHPDRNKVKLPLKVIINYSLTNNSAQVRRTNRYNLRQLVANRLGFGSHFTYQSAKKVKLQGSSQLIAQVDQRKLAISTAACLCELSVIEQNKILEESKKSIIKKAFELKANNHSNHLLINSKSVSVNEENHALSNVRCKNLV